MLSWCDADLMSKQEWENTFVKPIMAGALPCARDSACTLGPSSAICDQARTHAVATPTPLLPRAGQLPGANPMEVRKMNEALAVFHDITDRWVMIATQYQTLSDNAAPISAARAVARAGIICPGTHSIAVLLLHCSMVHRRGEDILKEELFPKREVVLKLSLTPVQDRVYRRYLQMLDTVCCHAAVRCAMDHLRFCSLHACGAHPLQGTREMSRRSVIGDALKLRMVGTLWCVLLWCVLLWFALRAAALGFQHLLQAHAAASVHACCAADLRPPVCLQDLA